jgi:NAD(P)-dependent dehydrogenase (short-subunit alcohol dehydrogenase family)
VKTTFYLLCTDLTQTDAVQQMAAQTIDRFPRIDILANIVSGFAMGPRLHETPLETWDFGLDFMRVGSGQ